MGEIHDEEVNEQVSRRAFVSTGMLGLAALAMPAASASGQLKEPVQPAKGRANPNGRFAGKVAVITGGTYGIGEGTARAFAMEGAVVHFCGRNEDLGRKVADAIAAVGGKASYQRADVTREAEVKAFIDEAVRRYGRIDIAFNNAGYFMDSKNPKKTPSLIQDITPEHWETMMNTNARGVMLSMKYEIPVMLRQGGGCIVNNASVSGHTAFAQMGAYAASKHAIIGLTKVAAVENADKNIRINSISPLAVDTPMIRDSFAYYKITMEQAAAANPMKRINTVEEMARAVMWLSSDEATSVTGMDLDVTGAYLAK
ncbi:MAG TPA: SDR family oxidoreductase [Pyrinomonadaceae bacterium]|nr:SDR family oxidoreductase [Pyrinomonadaceae bacterium]